MIIVCPYEPRIHPLCDEALNLHAPGTVRHPLGPNTTAYWNFLHALWKDQVTFAIIEHDIEIHDQVVSEFQSCAQPWCVFPYAGPGWRDGERGLLDHSLGCTRFGTELMMFEPEMMDSIGNVVTLGQTEQGRRDWRLLDVKIFDYLRKRGYQPHVHIPPVIHHHQYNYGCSCGSDHEGDDE